MLTVFVDVTAHAVRAATKARAMKRFMPLFSTCQAARHNARLHAYDRLTGGHAHTVAQFP
jgi:hypothetical protein